MGFLTLCIGFFLGVLLIVSFEILGLYFLVKRLSKYKVKDEDETKHTSPEDHGDHLDLPYPSKQVFFFLPFSSHSIYCLYIGRNANVFFFVLT